MQGLVESVLWLLGFCVGPHLEIRPSPSDERQKPTCWPRSMCRLVSSSCGLSKPIRHADVVPLGFKVKSHADDQRWVFGFQATGQASQGSRPRGSECARCGQVALPGVRLLDEERASFFPLFIFFLFFFFFFFGGGGLDF